jgi:hypothetical protein
MLSQILAELTDKPAKERLSQRCLQYLREHGVPEEVILRLDECAYARHIRLGPVTLCRLSSVDAENSREANSACIDGGLLIVGSGLNGDPIAIELASGRIAFISHDLLWEGDFEDVGECVVRTPLSFDEFWTAAAQSPDFPRDSYDARKRW